jgi:hypothetical protein
MKLYVCWTTADHPGTHACTEAYKALKAAGHDPEIVKARSWGALPDALQTSARKQVKAGTGEYWVPALERDDLGWVSGSDEIIAWAGANPA